MEIAGGNAVFRLLAERAEVDCLHGAGEADVFEKLLIGRGGGSFARRSTRRLLGEVEGDWVCAHVDATAEGTLGGALW